MRLAAPLLALSAALAACAGGPRVRTADGAKIDPLAARGAPAVVLVFTDTECPISNAYAPEVRRIEVEYGARGVRFFLVYADADRTADEVRAHRAAYGYAMPAVLDPEHALAHRAGATRVPEACVFLPTGELVYRGRIDDRWFELGKQRAAPTARDLCAALDAVLAGARPATPWPEAIGCNIPPLRGG